MDRNTFDQILRTMKKRSPYRPFTISLSNGERVMIDRSEALAVRDGLGMFVGPGGIPANFDYQEVVQIIG